MPPIDWSNLTPAPPAGTPVYGRDLDALFDTESEREGILPARLTQAKLAEAFGPFFSAKPGQKYRATFGTIRNVGSAGGYWQPISDAAHKPSNLASVTTDGSEITVNYGFNGTGIGTFLAVPDETMASEGFLMGSSVAANQAKIRLGRRKTLVDYVFWDATLNGGAGGFKSANNVYQVGSFTAGVLTLNHAPVIGGFQNNVHLNSRGGAYRPVVSTSGGPLDLTSTKIEFWNAAGTLATVGHPDMKAYVARYDISGWVDPRTAIDTTTHPNHNIWVFGIHEV